MWNIFRAKLCLFLALAAIALGVDQSTSAEDHSFDREANSCVETPTDTVPRGTALLVHGLNNRPSIMDELGAEFRRLGFSTFQSSLPWHGASSDIEPTLSNLRSAVSHCAGLALAGNQKAKHVAIGFSLGGALITDFVLNNNEAAFDTLILFAPAINLTTKARLGSNLTFLRHLNINIPTLANKEIRNSRWVPAELYHSLYELSGQLRSIEPDSKLNASPATIFLSTSDTLVAPRGTLDWLQSNKLLSWNVVELFPEPEISNTFNHLLVTEQGLGKNEWNRVRATLKTIVAK